MGHECSLANPNPASSARVGVGTAGAYTAQDSGSGATARTCCMVVRWTVHLM